MEEQTVQQLDNLLLQLGIDTQELAQRKDDIKQQIQIFESSIQEKKDYINTSQKTIRKLDEEIQQKQDTVKFIKENTTNLQQTGSLLLQYEKTLEAELEKRQESYNQDMRIFQDRIESYRTVFQQYKDRYCLNSLAQKLLQIQAENEDIEKRIRGTEEQIVEKERELKVALGVDQPVSPTEGADSFTSTKCEENGALQTDNKSLEELDCHQNPETQTPAEDASDHDMSVEDLTEENMSKVAGREDLSECDTDMFSYSSWMKSDGVSDQMQDFEQKRSEEENEQEESVQAACGSEFMVETSEENDGEKTRTGSSEETASEGVICPPPSSARMKAVLTTPTFSLNNSPSCSPGAQDISESKSPAFVFSMNSAPSTPAFGCDFDMGSSAEEVSPFTFTSSYFSNKKSPGSASKFSAGFLFDEAEGRQEEFSFSFGGENPQQSSTPQTAAAAESFPFTFSFGKL